MSKKIDAKKVIVNLDLGIAGVSFAILVILTFLGVVMRYAFRKPFTWLEEVQVGLFIWVSFFGGVAAFRTKGHVSIASIYDALPRRGKIVDSVFVAVVVVAALSYFFLKSLDMVIMFVQTNKSTSVLSIPSAFLFGVVPLCCILMIVNYLYVAIPDFKKLLANKETLKEETK